MDRREFLGFFGAAAAVVGYDALAGRWVSAAAPGPEAFDALPQLDGQLYFDPYHRGQDSRDQGNVVHRLPLAVLVPGSVADVQKMVQYCNRRRIEVATRGQHHSMHGQGLTSGLLIESAGLSEVHEITPTSATVGAGITWKALVQATLEKGLRPRGLLGYQGLSVGGTLSVGGCTMNFRGALVDNVRALQVVTGAGDLVECSEETERDLFEAMLGGLGQCGVITAATVDLVPALPMARTYLLTYTDLHAFLQDFRALVDRGEVEDCFNVCMPPTQSKFVYQLNATVFFDPAAPPDDAHLLRGLTIPAALVPHRDRAYFDYVTDVDNQVAVLKAAVKWDDLAKPWYDVWLPDDAVERHLAEVVAELRPGDVGTGGFVLLFAQRRSALQRPFFRVPDAQGGDRVWLFDVATSSTLPGPDAGFAARMTRRNRRWFERARALGGTRYPIGVLDFTKRDWRKHYGDAWPRFAALKQRYDPNNIMTPGPGIF